VIFILHVVMAMIFLSNKEIFPQNPNFSISTY